MSDARAFIAETEAWLRDLRREHAQWEFENGGSILPLMLADFGCETVEDAAVLLANDYYQQHPAKDPDELVRRHGADGWQRALAAAEPIPAWWAHRMLEETPRPDAGTIRRWLTSGFGPAWLAIPDELLRREAIEQVCGVLGISAAEAVSVIRGVQQPHRTEPAQKVSFGSVLREMMQEAEN